MRLHKKKKKDNIDITEEIILAEEDFMEEEVTPRKKLPGWIIVPIILVLVLLAFGLQKLFGTSSKEQTSASLQVEAVSMGSVQEIYTTSGTIASEQSKTYYSPVNAPIINCNAVVGNTVKAGDVLITYDIKDLERNNQESQLNLRASKAGRQAAIDQSNQAIEAENAAKAKQVETANALEAQLKDMEGQVNAAKAQWEQNQSSASAEIEANAQAREALNSKIQSLRETIENCNATMDSTVFDSEEYKKAAAQKEQAIKDLELAQKDLDSIQDPVVDDAGLAELQAKYDAKYAEWEAAYQAANSATSSASSLSSAELEKMSIDGELAALAALTPAELVEKGKEGIKADMDGVISAVEVASGDSALQGNALFTIASNKNVKVTIEISPDDYGKIKKDTPATVKVGDKTYNGTLSKINKIATKNEKGNNVIGAEIHINNPDEDLCIGATAKVTMTIAEADHVLTIPGQAINTSSEGDFVYVIENNVVKIKNVELGTTSNTKAEVISGLKEGDKVVTDLSMEITEGMTATPVENDSDESAGKEE
ncbi:MAG: efflux RND transporter periplasmic adaptor subunit [Hespellia sp.]|jgi:HlyD family secretion protein|nr:efflux RND transporter periplasmic adaptor subunit [Hespellia sp.]